MKKKNVIPCSENISSQVEVKFNEQSSLVMNESQKSDKNVIEVKLEENLFEVESSLVNQDQEEKGKVENKGVKKLCSCGSVFKISGDKVWDLVDLFEHIFASGSPNYARCRISLPYQNLNISA